MLIMKSCVYLQNIKLYCILEILQATVMVSIFTLYVVCIFWKLYLFYGEGLYCFQEGFYKTLFLGPLTLIFRPPSFSG